jgi:hypothetical protein
VRYSPSRRPKVLGTLDGWEQKFPSKISELSNPQPHQEQSHFRLFLQQISPFCTPHITSGSLEEDTMGTGKKERNRLVRQGKTGDGMQNVKVKGENFYRLVDHDFNGPMDR